MAIMHFAIVAAAAMVLVMSLSFSKPNRPQHQWG